HPYDEEQAPSRSATLPLRLPPPGGRHREQEAGPPVTFACARGCERIKAQNIMRLELFRVASICLAAALTGCATADFTPYVGEQQKWPTSSGAFVQTVEAGHGPMAEGGVYKLPVYFGPPNRPYRVIGSIDAESGNLAMWQSGKIESLRPAVKEAAQHGADAVIVLAQDVETRGYSTSSFAQGQSNTNFNASAYGNSIYGNAN